MLAAGRLEVHVAQEPVRRISSYAAANAGPGAFTSTSRSGAVMLCAPQVRVTAGVVSVVIGRGYVAGAPGRVDTGRPEGAGSVPHPASRPQRYRR